MAFNLCRWAMSPFIFGQLALMAVHWHLDAQLLTLLYYNITLGFYIIIVSLKYSVLSPILHDIPRTLGMGPKHPWVSKTNKIFVSHLLFTWLIIELLKWLPSFCFQQIDYDLCLMKFYTFYDQNIWKWDS